MNGSDSYQVMRGLKVKLFGKQTELIGSTPDRAEEVIMTRPPRQDADITALLSPLIAVGEGAPSLEEKLRLAQLIRAQSRDAGKQVDAFLIDEIIRRRMDLLDARDNQSKLQALLDELTSPPCPRVDVAADRRDVGRVLAATYV